MYVGKGGTMKKTTLITIVGIFILTLFTPIVNAQDKTLAETKTRIKQQKLKWTAGETSVSKMSHENKKRLFGGEIPKNLNGFEYYKSGVFELFEPKPKKHSSEDLGGSSMINHFDWRNRHNINWITPVRNQGPCGSCWAFSTIGVVEALTNLYFNQQLNLDLSEQDILSCSNAGDCINGGYPYLAFDYIQFNGVSNEECFEYMAEDLLCEEKCPEPVELIKISGTTWINPGDGEDNIKRLLINHGPLNFGIADWWHYMILVGYETDEIGTIWILKNSWGTDWGENGYVKMRVELTNIYGLYFVNLPVVSENPTEIICEDLDNDGYYNWGLSINQPINCPDDVLGEKDCDDSNPLLGPFSEDGSCVELLPPEPEPPLPDPEPEPPLPDPPDDDNDDNNNNNNGCFIGVIY